MRAGRYGFCSLATSLWLVSCVSTSHRDMTREVISFKTLLKPDDSMIRASVLIMGYAAGEGHTFCNGTFVEPGVVITAAHCLPDDFNFIVFLPVAVHAESPFTKIDLKAVPALSAERHKEFAHDIEEGRVIHDIGLLRLGKSKEQTLLRPVALLSAGVDIPLPKNLSWVGNDEPYFSSDVTNQVELISYKIEQDKILKGIFLTRDSASLVGEAKKNKSLLVSLNPGTSVHKGVSGSGLFYRRNGKDYLIGVASHIFPGINLMSSTSVRLYDQWLMQTAPDSDAQGPAISRASP